MCLSFVLCVYVSNNYVGAVRIWDLETGNLVKAQEREENSKHAITDIM